MNLGIIARCDNRGLGNQTWEIARHFPDARVLVIHDPRSINKGFTEHPDRFPNAHHTTIEPLELDAQLNETDARHFLDGLDVVYTAETPYDWNFCTWADEMDVRTVVHVNPEFWHHARLPHLPTPTAWWNPTTWRQRRLPTGTRIVPMPAPTDRFPDTPDFTNNPKHVLHVGPTDTDTPEDRNGTDLVHATARQLNDYTFTSTSDIDTVTDYWDLYNNDAPLLLIPRRYGGLCLPTIEAMAAGKAVMMTDTQPNRDWPTILTPTYRNGPRPRTLSAPGGSIDLADSHPTTIAATIERNWPQIAEHRRTSWEWAQRHSWQQLLPRWRTELERVANL